VLSRAQWMRIVLLGVVMAAGTLLVQEAGGRVSNMCGQPHSLTTSDDLVADNGILHDQIIEIFSEISNGTPRVAMPPLG